MHQKDGMRSAILILCFVVALSGFGAERRAMSVEELARSLKESYVQRDPSVFLSHYYTNGSPPDVREAITNSIAANWGVGKWVVKNVRVHSISDYQPTTGVPSEFNGKKLEWLIPPSHWIILETELPKDGSLSGQMKIELAVAKKDERWWIVGVR